MLAHAAWAPALRGARVLDAFAGTGALGLEALSRGAAHASFIEKDRAALGMLRANVAACAAGTQATLLPGDALRPPPGEACDLVFLDPPYGQGLIPRAVPALQAAGWLDPAGVLVAEIGRDEAAPFEAAALMDRTHGAARLLAYALADISGARTSARFPPG